MFEKIAVEIIFLLSCLSMIYFIIRRPFLYIRLGVRRIRLETYFIGALLGPFLILFFGLMNYSQILSGFRGINGLNPFGVLILFLSMVFMSIFLDITGFFECCARIALRYAKGSALKLFFSIYLIVSVLTIFTSNDIIILTFTPFIYYFSKHAGLDPVPFLIAEFFAANTWSMMFFIGNPTNIVLSAAFDITFLEYLRYMFFPTCAAGIVNLVLLYLLFRKKLKKPLEHIDEIKPLEALTDRIGALLGLVLLSSCIIFLSIAPYIGLNIWMVSFGFALVLVIILIIRDSFTVILSKEVIVSQFSFLKTLKRMPLSIIPFILALFVSVEALRYYGVTTEIGLVFEGIVKGSSIFFIFLYGATSAFAANIFNNIPMTVAYVSILQVHDPAVVTPGVFATVIGSNLGANLTPIGALAGIMWMMMLRTKDVGISFRRFMFYGLLVTPMTLFVSLTVLS
ncbi:MAG: ArsB/NhaD family transporter, partial [Candidatus Thermoplasmatota archaeon]|nr:ArsB/NhaD family transporter [Candidatus Thermoplasmatota archaeon]